MHRVTFDEDGFGGGMWEMMGAIALYFVRT